MHNLRKDATHFCQKMNGSRPLRSRHACKGGAPATAGRRQVRCWSARIRYWSARIRWPAETGLTFGNVLPVFACIGISFCRSQSSTLRSRKAHGCVFFALDFCFKSSDKYQCYKETGGGEAVEMKDLGMGKHFRKRASGEGGE